VITYSFLLYSSVRSKNDNTTGLEKEEKERNNSNLVFPEFSKVQNIIIKGLLSDNCNWKFVILKSRP